MSDTDLTAFLNARLDEDEAAAKTADPGPWEVGGHLGGRDSMVYVREEGSLVDTVGITYRPPVFTSQVPNKTQFRENAVHIARHDPARALREIASARRILELSDDADWLDRALDEEVARTAKPGEVTLGEEIRRALAAVWSDHPDFKAEWTATAPAPQG